MEFYLKQRGSFTAALIRSFAEKLEAYRGRKYTEIHIKYFLGTALPSEGYEV
jgi:hypothetical protein